MDSFPENERSDTQFYTTFSVYHFDDGKVFNATKKKIPADIANHKVTIETNVKDNDVPLLLSRASMKLAGINVSFEDGPASDSGEVTDLVVTKCGHYTVPLTIPCRKNNSWSQINVKLSLQ